MDNNPRFDLYTAIHKTQRFHLGRLAERIGRANPTEPDVCQALGVEVHHWLEHLRAHAHHEHTLIHPLLARYGASATHLDAEHERLEQSMDELEAVVAAGRWPELYGRFAAFLGAYFVHIAEEERVQETVLWPRYSDAELADVFVRFRNSRSVEEARHDLEIMLPALSMGELSRIYGGIRASASVDVWEASLALARRFLTSSEVLQLEAGRTASRVDRISASC